MGANTLSLVFDEKYYRDLNGGILEAFGILIQSGSQELYLYPWKDQPTGELWTVETTPVHPRMQPLFDYLRFNKRVVDIPYDEAVLGIFSKDALDMIKSGDDGWEAMVPDFVDRIIKENVCSVIVASLRLDGSNPRRYREGGCPSHITESKHDRRGIHCAKNCPQKSPSSDGLFRSVIEAMASRFFLLFNGSQHLSWRRR